jgi:YggT family protein
VLLDTISQIELFVRVFAGVYVLALILYILTSWVRLPYSLQPVQRFLGDVCEPYLRFWRRLLPFAVGPLDFSPIVGIIAIGLVASLVNAILSRF